MEIYNENIYDLLDHCSTRSVNLRESQTHGVYAEGIIQRSVSNSWEAWNVSGLLMNYFLSLKLVIVNVNVAYL